ncbi:hypothetical protein DV737_g245, partial [Chaetothyriales sp. CBS 132003]
MSADALLRKDQLERSLYDEKKLIEEGVLKEDNPLDLTHSFRVLCEACRRGDLKTCQEKIQEGVNINAKDEFDYTPLILASLCGNYDTVHLLLESGALCERDTFQGERCLYNALNDRIRNLLLSYDYSKSTDPLQPLAAHLTSLLSRDQPKTADLSVGAAGAIFRVHKFILAARSPYFQRKLSAAPDTASWKLPLTIPPQSFEIALKHLYLGELPREVGGGPGTGFSDSEVLAGLDRISRHLEIQNLSHLLLESGDRRLARQRRQDEVERGRDQLEAWFLANTAALDGREAKESASNVLGIPLAASVESRSPPSRTRSSRKSKVYPCHKAMLVRSEYFMAMLDSQFREAQEMSHLQVVSIDCSPAVLEIILTFLYTEKAEFGLDVAVDVLFAADMLFLEKVKAKAAVIISTLANGTATTMATEDGRQDEVLDIYAVLRAAWLTRTQRLEEFAARYMAYRLEQYIDDPEFAELIEESAGRISARQETDSIELVDDIRFYLSERFRLRFEDVGLLDEDEERGLAEAQQQGDRESVAGTADKPQHRHWPGEDEGLMLQGVVRTLDGEEAGDEFAADAFNYQLLLGKIDALLERLNLDA